MNTINIKDKLAAERNVEPVLVDKDNGTQTFEGTKTEKVTAPIQMEGAAQMDNTEPDGVKVDYIETPVVVREKRIIDESIKADDYNELLQKYKLQNPKKYEAKKAEFARKFPGFRGADEISDDSEDSKEKKLTKDVTKKSK